MLEKLCYFLKNRVKIKIFGASRRHIRGSKHLEGGDPPPEKSSRRSAPRLEGGDPPPQIFNFEGGDFKFEGGDLSKFFFEGGDPPPHPPPLWKTLDTDAVN